MRAWQALALITAVACAGPADDPTVVFAAASLRVAIAEAGAEWGEPIVISAAGSQVLRRQIEGGAPAEVFVPASFAHTDERAIAAMLEPPQELICNELVLVVPRGSTVRSLEALSDAHHIVLGIPEVPVGSYADHLLRAAGRRYGAAWHRRVMSRVASREIDARQVLAKVTLGEADAALVYASDAAMADVRRIDPPEDLTVRVRYPIAIVRTARPRARRFVRWLRSDAGIAVLERHGFARCGRRLGERAGP